MQQCIIVHTIERNLHKDAALYPVDHFPAIRADQVIESPVIIRKAEDHVRLPYPAQLPRYLSRHRRAS